MAEKTTDEARADLLAALPYIQFAVEEAAKNGTPKLAIVAIAEKGGGKVHCQFDTGFLEDLAKVVGASPLSDQDRLKASARQFCAQHGL